MMAGTMNDAVLEYLKQRFPKEFEIAYLTVRNQLMKNRLEELAKKNPPPKAAPK